MALTEPKPSSAERASLYLHAAMTAIKDAGGELASKDVVAEVRKRVEMRPVDLETYEKTGYPKWRSVLQFYSIDYVKAGFIYKSGRRWYLTEAGEALMDKPPMEVMVLARAAYKKWKATQGSTSDNGADHSEEEVEEASQTSLIFDEAESRAHEEIRDHVAKLSPYEFQDLVAATLRAMGYTTPVIAKPGKDGGTDILAYPDPLGTETPHIRVQVKHRPDTPTARKEVAELRGIVRADREVGLFVSSGGYSKDSIKEAEQGAVHIRLLDLDELLELWQTHYDKISEEDRALLRLRRVYFLSPE